MHSASDGVVRVWEVTPPEMRGHDGDGDSHGGSDGGFGAGGNAGSGTEGVLGTGSSRSDVEVRTIQPVHLFRVGSGCSRACNMGHTATGKAMASPLGHGSAWFMQAMVGNSESAGFV